MQIYDVIMSADKVTLEIDVPVMNIVVTEYGSSYVI